MLYSMKALVFAAFVATAVATTEAEYQTAFTNWMQQNGKSYASAEFQNRYNIFKQNFDYVNQWNANNSETKLATNFMADLTNKEYRRIYLGSKYDATADLANAAPFTPIVGAPASVDWVKEGAVTPVKDQGQCGSCWSFSSTGGIEGAHFLATKNLVSCSEQQLVDCSGSYGNKGCNGGFMPASFQYVIDNKGIDSESSYPYKAVQGKCEFNKDHVVATISKSTNVAAGSEAALLAAVVERPVSVAIDASHQSFQLYHSGVYYESACKPNKLDHAVLAVGYGTSGSSEYWLVKNSWGAAKWGMEGYIWMARNKNNNCGIASAACYPQ